jgi:hypothetical protein
MHRKCVRHGSVARFAAFDLNIFPGTMIVGVRQVLLVHQFSPDLIKDSIFVRCL